MYEHVSATYRPSLPPVLRNICFQLKGGSTCGVVGRTGSGKVSFFVFSSKVCRFCRYNACEGKRGEEERKGREDNTGVRGKQQTQARLG